MYQQPPAPYVPPQQPKKKPSPLRVILIAVGSVFGLLLLVGIVGAALGIGKKPASTPAAVDSRTSSAAAVTSSTAARIVAPSTAQTATTTAAPKVTVTGFGATVATWDAAHTADTVFAAGSVFDADPGLPQINGNEGARYVDVQYEVGRALHYQVNEPTSTALKAALADVVHREMPADAVVVWTLSQASNGCYLEEVTSATLGSVLADPSVGDPRGAVLLEAQSASLNAFDPSNVVDVLLTLGGDSLTAAAAPGC